MRKILSLCISLLPLIISGAVPLKLIAGERNVVKKDGATHTISKYYVVPNDFNSNNVTNSTVTSQATLRMNHGHYAKSMDDEYADTASDHQVSEKRAEAANDKINKNNADVNNTEVNLRSGLNYAQVDVATQTHDNTAESKGSVTTEQSLNSDDLGNLQVEPITSSIKINSNVTSDDNNVYNSSEALQNGTSLIVENTTHTFQKDVKDELDDLILTKFGTAVQESFVKNIESFWKLIKLNRVRISDYDESLRKIKKLYLLLNIFTNLYEAAQLQNPVESMIDSIIDILQIPFVEKSNTNESQSQTNVSGDYDEECLRKCGLKHSKPQLDSNGTYLSETKSLKASGNLELKNLDLQRRQRSDSDDGENLVNASNDPGSNQVTVGNHPTNVLRSQIIVPNNLNVGVSNGFNVRSSIPTLTLNHVSRENDVQDDPKSNQTISDSAEIDENLDDQSLTIESRLTDDLPWHIENNTTDNLPWNIEDKTTNHWPWIIEHRTTNTLPWTNNDKITKKVPWKFENRADPNWIIDNKIGHSPLITLYQSKDPSVITHGGKILLHPNQPMTGTVHRVKHGVKKPYHVYTYVLNPATSLYEILNSGNIDKVKSRQPNPERKLYGLFNSHGGNKVVYNNKPLASYYESQFSLSKPSVDISSQTSNSQLKHTNYVTSPYDTRNEVNPSYLSFIPDDNDQPKYLFGHELDTNHKPKHIQPNTLPSDSQTNSDQENEVPQVPKVGSHPGVLLPNVPSNPFELLMNIGNTGSVSTASASASADTGDVNHDIGDTEPNPYNPNINLNHIQQTNLHPGEISKASSYSEYNFFSDDYNKPSPVYGGETHQHPDLISSSASSSSGYTNIPNEYDAPVYVEQTHQHPSLIPSSASSNSEYTKLDNYDEPGLVYGGHKHPRLISTSSSTSAYKNLPDEYDEPVYGGQIHQRPDMISTSASSSSGYTNLPSEYDGPVYVEQTHQHPSLIPSSASSNSEYTNLLDNYDEPGLVYGGHKHPRLISTSSSSSAYKNLPDEYDEPVYGGPIHQHPDMISTSPSSSSGYTNLPNEYDVPVYVEQTHQHPSLISSSASSNSKYTNLLDNYVEPSLVYGGHKHPRLISTSSSSSAYTNLPDEYDEPVYGGQIHQHPDLISTSASSSSGYTNAPNEYDGPSPVYDGQIHKHPGFTSEYTNLPNNYNNLTPDYEKDTDRYPVQIQTPVNGRPTEIEDNLLVPHHPNIHTVHIVQPSLIAHLHGNQPTGLNYLKHLKLKLEPTYRLFTLDNLLKLRDVIIKTIEVNGDEPDVYDNRALMNLRKIINIILLLAEHLEEPEGSIEWYEKIFYNTQKSRHPLDIYVYNLIRQRWLHELMLVLYKNNFDSNILQNPTVFSFLRAWQFPNYVLNFMEAENHIQHNIDAPEVFDQTFSSQHDLQDKFTHTYDDVLEDVPENLENYVINNVIDSYKTPNSGIVLSIAGVEAEPDANAIIHILQKYLHYKSYIEKQENVIIRDNKVEMLKQIILFLREKGYGARTISDLVHKLYTAVYSTEGKRCQTNHPNFAKNMYDVILPVLRRSGQ